ncbi:sodium- and chloride-dependent GABA transporter 1-like isoform X2 [Bolinopsis microptera]|uniref:sodium- and chloride-dependent GABA transporter 1-like isoform X2 n=1 Tax=Bolinopsis microptera TaxID=2820187 RepID=UPI00307940E9
MASYQLVPQENSKKAELEKKEEEEETELEKKEEEEEGKPRERWGNHMEFLLAAIGFAVGTGNVWRFPYLAQKNGGGAFLLPYAIMLLVEGLPLFYLELALGQKMQMGFIKIWTSIRPYFKGIGIGQLIVCLQMTAYFPMVMTWCMYYFYLSFSSPLPWQECADKNDMCCMNDSAAHLWYESSLQATPSIDDTGEFIPAIAGCWFIGWVLTYMCLFKGIQSSGKAAYFTATFPYVVLIALFIRGVTLEGAGNGIKVFFTPDFEKLLDPFIWMDAAGQIFYSIGVGFGAIICFGSYNPVKNNCSRDALIISLVNCGTSVFAGIVVYSVLGFREAKLGIPVEDMTGGPGLAFIAYPTAVAEMPLSQMWAAAFFFMMILLAIDSEFGVIEACVGPLQDYPFFRQVRKEILCLLVCLFLCLVGLPMCTQSGLYVFVLWDTFSVALPLLFIGVAECIAIGWFYGLDKICDDIEYMTGSQPHVYWKICWKFVSPAVITIILIASLVKTCLNPPQYTTYVGCDPLNPTGSKDWTKDVPFTWWSQILGAVMVMLPVLPMPLFAAWHFLSERFFSGDRNCEVIQFHVP